MQNTALDRGFVDVFPEVGSDEAVTGFFREVAIKNVAFYKKSRRFEVRAAS